MPAHNIANIQKVWLFSSDDMKKAVKFVLLASLVLILTAAGDFVLAAEAKPPRPPARSEIEKILTKAPPALPAEDLRPLNIVLLADVKDHGENEHDYPLWQKRWALLLCGKAASDEKQTNLFGPAIPQKTFGAPKVTVTTAWRWPSDEQFRTADCIVVFCYLKMDSAERIQQVRQYLERGGGLVPIHPASWHQPKPSQQVARLLGVGGYKKYRHGHIEMKIVAPQHPICLGLPEKLHFYDETYWPATPLEKTVTVLATSDEVVNNRGDKLPQPTFWTYRCGKGRVFGCQPGHFVWTFDDPYFRILLLRGIAWAAGESPYRFDSLVLCGARLSSDSSGENPKGKTE